MASVRGSVRKKPSGRWEARYRDASNKMHARTFVTKGEAQHFVNSVLVQLQRGEWTNPNDGRLTLREWAKDWLDLAGKRATTMSRDRCVLEKHWLTPLGDRRLSSLTPADVQAVVKTMTARLAPKTVATNYGVFRACINAAVEAERISRTPCRGVKLPAADVDADEIRFLERDELNRLADHLPPDLRAMVYVAGVLGLRWSEVVGLRVGRIDFLKRTVSVVETMAEVNGKISVAPVKTKASRRTLAMPPFLVEMLAAHLADTGRTDSTALVFQRSDGGPLRASNFRRRVWAPAVKAAGLNGLTFHGLRHTAVGLMISLGYQAAVIQKRMGHASIRTTMDVYGHLLPSADEAVADGLERLFVPEAGSLTLVG
jgi:integrase